MLLFGCNSRLQDARIEKTKDSIALVKVENSVLSVSSDKETIDSAINDEPVMIDTAAPVIKKNIAQVSDLPPPAAVKKAIVEKKASIQEAYTGYIGVREATGKNDGKQVEKFLKNVGLGPGFPWCAAFVKTCLIEAGIKSANAINGMALSCHNGKNIVFFKSKKVKDVQPGDVFTLYYAHLKRIGHTGFVDHQVNSSVYESVEGNTNSAGSREGDGVYKKKRSFNATYSITRWE